MDERLVPTRPNPAIRKLERLVALSAADRGWLERVEAEARLVGARTDLIVEGSDPDGAILILEGIACRHKHRANGRRQITAYLLPGDMSDLEAVFQDRMPHGVSTITPCRIARLSPRTLSESVHQSQALSQAARMLSLIDEATYGEWLLNLGCRSGVERLAHLICELFHRLRAVGLTTGNSFSLPVTQVDLAHTLGLSGVHTNRSLQELRHQRVIRLAERRLTILDLPRLMAIAEFDPSYLNLAPGGG